MKPMTAAETEMWEVCQALRPDITRAQFRMKWAGFLKLRREHAAKREDPSNA